jgi:hypothetical protein
MNKSGSKSKYINSRNIPVIKQFFPNARLETLDAGHWGASPLAVEQLLPPFLVLFSLACSGEHPDRS